MLDLRNFYSSASGHIQTWRNRYSPAEYPHKIVVNMMYRAYATRLVYQAFQKGELPPFDDINEAETYVREFYSQTAICEVRDNLLNWMLLNPTELVGTISADRYEALATRAEQDSSQLEELEFSFIFESMSDMCVLYFIGLRLCGNSQEETILKMTNYQVVIDEELSYAQLKTAFTQLNRFLPEFLQRNYRPF